MTYRKRLRLCRYPGCKHLTMAGYCELHAKSTKYHTSPAARESKKFLNSAAWLNLRDLKISMHPWCEECAKSKPISVPAHEVDHVLPRHTHPSLKLDINNLQSLCKECHGKKTRKGL